MNKRDLFEQNIKNAVEDFEAPFDKSAWKKIDQQLSAGSAKGLNGIKSWVAGVIVVAVTATGIWYFTKPSSPKGIDSNELEQVDQIENAKTIENDVIEKSIVKPEIQSVESVNENVVKDEADSKQNEFTNSSDKAIESESDNPISNDETKQNAEISTEQTQPNALSDDDESLNVNWIISKNEMCQGEELMVSISDVNEPVELIWDFGDGESSTDSKVIHQYAEPGTYTVKLKAKSLISDRKVYREIKYIDVKAKPQSEFTIVKNENMSAFPEVEFKNATKYFSQIEWVFPDGNIENKNTVDKFYRYKGRYQIGLIVTNHFGCKDSIYKDLVIENDYNLLAPDAFTPNGDGMNDTFLPEALTFLNKNFSMQVINTKNGRLVFETQNIEKPWNGKYNNSGAILNEGLYAWTVKFDDGSIYSGSVKLITD